MVVEKAPLQSKKFVAFLVSEATWKVVLAVILVVGIKADQVDVWLGGIALAVIIVAGFIEAGYIIGQASLDKYTRIAELATNAGQSFSSKSMAIGGKTAPDTAPKDPKPPVRKVKKDDEGATE